MATTRIPLLIGIIVLTGGSPASALTAEHILPQNLVGKTLTFTIGNAAGPILKTGSWTGTFEAWPPRTLTIENVTGNTDNVTSTYSVGASPGQTGLGVVPFYADSVQGTILLTISGGIGQFAASSTDAETREISTQNGTFTIVGVVDAPEITVRQPDGTALMDGTAAVSLGKVRIGKTGKLKTFRISNNGDADLTGLSIAKTGKNKADFIIGKLSKTTLIKGASTTFTVAFKPGKTGARTAAIKIASNDADENPFDIKLTGTGLAR
jgi:Abnormal spindle-like microcephaly-assoc'd, ASPM-SPD-2-Hydin